LDEAFLRGDPALGAVFTQLQDVIRQREQLQNQIPTTMVLRELPQPRPVHVQIRGDFLKPGPEAQPNVPAALPPLSTGAARSTRLDLARWLVRSDNPLTPRARVNRLWMHLFGVGLVETENDFGTQGTPPVNPDLLDALAAEDLSQQWSTKQMLRRIVTSATYRQRSHAVGPAATSDPRNRLLWRQNRLRVEGEIVRDLALAASGLLTRVLGGPSVYPPQSPGVYAFTQREQPWRTSTGADRYRRGMYTFFYRSAPHPMLSTFDAPAFNQACTRRDRSNTPLQSLTVANEESMIEAAQALARAELPHDAARDATAALVALFRRALVRPPQPAELQYLARFLQQQREHFAAQPEAAKKLAPAGLPPTIPPHESAAWVAVARVLLNLDEFITRE
jgi:hypothetical protein